MQPLHSELEHSRLVGLHRRLILALSYGSMYLSFTDNLGLFRKWRAVLSWGLWELELGSIIHGVISRRVKVCVHSGTATGTLSLVFGPVWGWVAIDPHRLIRGASTDLTSPDF